MIDCDVFGVITLKSIVPLMMNHHYIEGNVYLCKGRKCFLPACITKLLANTFITIFDKQ